MYNVHWGPPPRLPAAARPPFAWPSSILSGRPPGRPPASLGWRAATSHPTACIRSHTACLLMYNGERYPPIFGTLPLDAHDFVAQSGCHPHCTLLKQAGAFKGLFRCVVTGALWGRCRAERSDLVRIQKQPGSSRRKIKLSQQSTRKEKVLGFHRHTEDSKAFYRSHMYICTCIHMCIYFCVDT